MKKTHKDPSGGLTAAGREHFKKTEGANLKPGVKGPADTREKKKRKGSFLTRFYCKSPQPPFEKDGKPTRHALAARAWGESAPNSKASADKLCSKGRRFLDAIKKMKGKK